MARPLTDNERELQRTIYGITSDVDWDYTDDPDVLLQNLTNILEESRGNPEYNLPLVLNTSIVNEQDQLLCILADVAYSSRTEWVRTLLDYGADPNGCHDFRGKLPLIEVFKVNTFETTAIANLLVERGANLLLRDDDNKTVLFAAIVGGNREYVQTAIDAGVDVNTVTIMTGETPLLIAFLYEDEELVHILLAHHADPYVVTQDGTTVLAQASRSGNINLVRFALEVLHINPHWRDNRGLTALAIAVATRYRVRDWIPLIQLFIDHGSSIDELNGAWARRGPSVYERADPATKAFIDEWEEGLKDILVRGYAWKPEYARFFPLKFREEIEALVLIESQAKKSNDPEMQILAEALDNADLVSEHIIPGLAQAYAPREWIRR